MNPSKRKLSTPEEEALEVFGPILSTEFISRNIDQRFDFVYNCAHYIHEKARERANKGFGKYIKSAIVGTALGILSLSYGVSSLINNLDKYNSQPVIQRIEELDINLSELNKILPRIKPRGVLELQMSKFEERLVLERDSLQSLDSYNSLTQDLEKKVKQKKDFYLED